MVPAEDWSAPSLQCRCLGEMGGHLGEVGEGLCPVVSGEADGPGVLWKRQSSLCLRGPQDIIALEALNMEIVVTPCRQGSVLSTKPQKGLPWFRQAEPRGQDGGGTGISCRHLHTPGLRLLGHSHFRRGGAPPPQLLGDKRTHLGGGRSLTHFLCRRQGRNRRRHRTQAA